MAYEGFSRKDLIKMLEEANDSIEHYEKQSEIKDEEYEKMLKEKDDEISELESENAELTEFIAGNDAEPIVKEAIKRHYSQEFIDGNTERWAEIGLDFSEE